MEKPLDVGKGQVDGRAYDVAWRFPQELDQVFPEVGFVHLHPQGLEKGVHPKLLREHALGLHHPLHPVAGHNLPQDAVGFLGILRPVHLDAFFL